MCPYSSQKWIGVAAVGEFQPQVTGWGIPAEEEDSLPLFWQLKQLRDSGMWHLASSEHRISIDTERGINEHSHPGIISVVLSDLYGI